jgi:hypothetical protein
MIPVCGLVPYRWDAAIGRAIATRPLTVRIDLDGESDAAGSHGIGSEC